MASESLLETVATHEIALMEDLDRAREEARQVVEAAHAAGAALLQETNATLDSEIAVSRREAAKARENERVKIQQDTMAKVAHIRTDATGRIDAVRDELVSRILPNH